MATLNKQQGKDLHQLKLKLTKDPRATTVKIPTPTKHFPDNPGSTSNTNSPNAPVAKVLKLSDVFSLPITNPETLAPAKLTSKSPTAISQLPSTAVQPPAVKSPQTVLMNKPVVVPVVVPTKSPRKKQTMLVIPPPLKQTKQQLSLANPIVVKSPKIKQVVTVGETSTKLKPPPLKLVIQSESKRQSKKSQTILPTYRVRTIMKTNIKSSTSDGPLNIGQDSVAVISKATELFIAELVKGAHKTALESCHKDVTYGHLAKTVRKDPDRNKFLYEILPEKVLVRDYLAALNSQDPRTHT